jgi:hypothetical protein
MRLPFPTKEMIPTLLHDLHRVFSSHLQPERLIGESHRLLTPDVLFVPRTMRGYEAQRPSVRLKYDCRSAKPANSHGVFSLREQPTFHRHQINSQSANGAMCAGWRNHVADECAWESAQTDLGTTRGNSGRPQWMTVVLKAPVILTSGQLTQLPHLPFADPTPQAHAEYHSRRP